MARMAAERVESFVEEVIHHAPSLMGATGTLDWHPQLTPS